MLELPAQQPVTITDPFDVSSFATYLEKSERKRVTVLITANAKNVLPIDPAACHRQADGSADVVVLRDMKIQERFRQRIGERYYTINGGIRIYPADDSWRDAPRHSRYLPSREAFKPQALNVVLGYIKDAERHTRARQSALAERPVTPDSPKPSPIFDHSIDVSTPPQCPPVPDTRIWTISNGGQAKQLIDYLMNPRRDRPVVVLTRAAGQDEPFADRRQLSDHVGDIAAIADIAGTDATWALTEYLPNGLTTYGGACRVYPTGDLRTVNKYDVPLFFTVANADRERFTTRLEDEVLRLHYRNGYTSASTTIVKGVRAAGTVQGIVSTADRILLRLDNGSIAVIYTESLPLGLAAERLVAKGMHVTGTLQRDTGRFELDMSAMRDADEALRGYQAGMTVLARVASVYKDVCSLELFPGVKVQVPREDAGDEKDLRLELRKGETVAALVGMHEGDQWMLSIIEAGDAIEPAPSILAGGPPWLAAEDSAVGNLATAPRIRYSDDDLDSLIPASADAPSRDVICNLFASLLTQQHELDVLEPRLKQSEAANSQLRASNRQMRGKYKAMQRRLHGNNPVELLAGAFQDEREQLDFEIRVAWALRIPAGDKADLPLRAWDYAPQFFASLHSLQGIDHGKIVDVIVEILTGLVERIDGRDLHPLRVGSGGDDPVRRAEHGETYWRAALQIGTPGARRIHFYTRRDGVVILSSVRTHDDLRS